jgi:hypothetical protein
MKGVESSKAKIGINNGAMAAKWQYQLAKAMSRISSEHHGNKRNNGSVANGVMKMAGENISVAIMAAISVKA